MVRGGLIPWLGVGVWLLLLVPLFLSATADDQSLVDSLAYRRAAEALDRGDSPYEPVERTRATWIAFHQIDADLRAESERGAGTQMLQQLATQPRQPGPYVYPPTLASVVAAWRVSDRAFAIAIGLAIVGFTWLWLRSTGSSSWWLLLVIGSWDVLASLTGGNVEHLMLFAALVAARLLWTHRGWLAAVPIALVMLVKPFYVLFFIAFGLLQMRAAPAGSRRASACSLAVGAGLGLGLVGLEVVRWGPVLRDEALQYLRTSVDRLWLVLPVDQQTPMSAWNRTPLQVLVEVGVPAAVAQVAALGLWGALVGLTLRRVEPTGLGWARTCALAFVLLYLGRPVGWGLIYLELLILTVLWPELHGWRRAALLVGAIALMGSHWWALALTLQGHGLQLLTVQTAQWPWETVLVLPLAWWLLLVPPSRPPGRRAVDESVVAGAGAAFRHTM